MASVERLPSGRWRLAVYAGKDPLTGKKRYEKRTVDAADKRDAQKQANRWEVELADGDATGAKGTFGDLLDRYARHRKRSMSPSTVKETEGIIRRYLRHSALADVATEQVRTATLDEFYGLLAERGGRCTHRPCPRRPCPDHGPRCERKGCTRPPCEQHDGGCAAWDPCEQTPCAHGAPLSVATVRRVHVVVHAALEQAVVWGEVRRNQATHADPGLVVEEEVEPPAPEGLVRLLAAIEETDPPLADYLVTSIDSGARRGAVHALRWQHLNLQLGTARFPRVIVIGPDGLVDQPARKSKRSGALIALSPYTVARLQAHRRRMAERALAVGVTLPDDAYVFSDDPTCATPWRPDSTSRKFRVARFGGELDETRLHDLRHLMATVLLAAGIDPQVVAGRGGWSRVATMLERYAHVLEARDRDAAEAMGRLLGG